MDFTDVKFMSAKEKALTLKAWIRFIDGGFQGKDFTQRLYHHLIQHCSFIAHYSQGGFYGTYFEDPQNTIQFLNQFNSGVSAEYGMTYWLNGDYADINGAMCEIVKSRWIKLASELSGESRERDFKEAQRLLAKHGYTLAFEPEKAA